MKKQTKKKLEKQLEKQTKKQTKEQYKRQLTIASLVTLVPMLVGLILWNKLPMTMATHWGASGEVNGYGSKWFAVFVLPLILLAFFWVCVWFSSKDPKNKDQNKKAFSVVIWTVPLISCFTSGFTYAVSLGVRPNVTVILGLLFGVLFMLIGNYMPKAKQNFTLGIKIRSTLESEDNWNATHRVAGKVWFFGGLVMLACAFLPAKIAVFAIFAVLVILVAVPMVYSLVYRRKQLTATKNDIKPFEKNVQTKAAIWVSAVIVVLILIGASVLMFTGEITAVIEGDTLVVRATYYEESVLPLSQLHHIQLADHHDVGMRAVGFQSAKLKLGIFENDLYGVYTMYAYTNADSYIFINDGDRVFVLALKDAESTKALYEQLLEATA